MREEQVPGIVTVPVARQYNRNFFLRILYGLKFWMCDEVVVRDTAILRILAVIHGCHEVHLIAVAAIRTKQGGTEVGIVLRRIVAIAVIIVEVKAESQTFVGIDGKLGVDMVFTMLLVATVVVREMGVG